MSVELQSAPKGATMNQNLMNLRQRATMAATKFIRAQRAYLDAAAPYNRKTETELKEVAEGYHKAIKPYDAALQELRRYLLAAEPSGEIAAELERTERLIKTLNHEKIISSMLIERHIDLNAKNIRRNSRHAEEEVE
jgi:hypothetical protein